MLIRRCVDDPSEKAYSFVFAPLGTTLIEMVQAIGQRWKIEECFEIGKAIGLEDYEVLGFTAWYRHYSECSLAALGLSPNNVCYSRIVRSASIPNNIHITLVMLVQACLAGISAAISVSSAEPRTEAGTCPLLPLTILEVRHVLACLLWPLPRSPTLLLSWSWWRRCHQSRASYFHTQRRATRK